MLTWTFPPGMFDFDPSSDDDDEGGLEDGLEMFINSLMEDF